MNNILFGESSIFATASSSIHKMLRVLIGLLRFKEPWLKAAFSSFMKPLTPRLRHAIPMRRFDTLQVAHEEIPHPALIVFSASAMAAVRGQSADRNPSPRGPERPHSASWIRRERSCPFRRRRERDGPEVS